MGSEFVTPDAGKIKPDGFDLLEGSSTFLSDDNVGGGGSGAVIPVLKEGMEDECNFA